MKITYDIYIKNKETGRGTFLENIQFTSKAKAEIFKFQLEAASNECDVSIIKRKGFLIMKV